MDTRIYVMTHKEYMKPEDDLYHTLHVGKALGNDFGYAGDDTGDNISLKNKNYCELTGLYWIWKNVTCDIVGICHYRRYFFHAGDYIRKDYIEKVIADYPVIVPESQCTKEHTLWEHYAAQHYEKDMQVCREVIGRQCPQYLDAFDLCMNCNLFSVGNMVITRKEIFDAYCTWLFSILFEMETIVDISDYDTFQARIMGYLSERLFRVWLLGQAYRIKEEPVEMLDPQDCANAGAAVQLKYRYTALMIKALLEQYKAGTRGEPVCSEPLMVDFHGKIPVWVFWAQGLKTAPEGVLACIRSMEQKLPADLTELHIITMENIGSYITLPDWIVQRFNQGKMDLAHFSDILRMGLLYRYGGMWLDADCFLAKPLPPAWLTQNDFWTLNIKRTSLKADVTQGRWCLDILKGEAGEPVFGYALDALYEYWHNQDNLIDASLLDYIIAVGCDNFPYIRERIASCSMLQPQYLELAEVLGKTFDENYLNKLTADTVVFKVPYQVSVPKLNVVNKKTFYGYICD